MNTDLIKALRAKLQQLEKMRRHLTYSHDKIVAWWRVNANFDEWNEDQLESLAAFKGRFSEFQDHLASTMKLIALIEGEDTRQFTYVLNYMVKLYILDGADEWLKVRSLRNAATHDYTESEETKALHLHGLLAHTHYLYNTLDGLVRFTAAAYPEK